MKDCQTIDALVTPYVDGELPAVDRERVTDHLRACGSCHDRVAAEQAVHDLLARARASTLQQPRAPEQLRAACARLAAADAAPQASPRIVPNPVGLKPSRAVPPP